MKKISKKIKSIMNTQPRLFVLLLIIILFIVIFILYRVADKYLNYEKQEQGTYYTYIGDSKVKFDGKISINRKGIISGFETDKDLDLSNYVIYSKNRIIFPTSMILITQENYELYNLIPYSYISKNNIITKDSNKNIEHYVIFDGKNKYFFVDGGELNVDGTIIKIKGNCEINVSKDLNYYDYKSSKYEEIKEPKSVTYTNSYYKVNLVNDTIGQDEIKLPNSTNYLPTLKEYDNN